MHTLIQDYTKKSLEMEILAENGLYALNTIKVVFLFLFFSLSPLAAECQHLW